MEDIRIRKLAQYVIHTSIALQKGEKILIEMHGQAKPLAKALIEEAYLAGGEPFMNVFDYDLEGAVIRGSSESHMEDISVYALTQMKDMDAYVDIRVMDNIYKWSSIPAEKSEFYRRHYWGPVHLEERCQHTRWAVMMYPTPGAAQQFKMSTEDYENFYFNACLVDYAKMGRAMENLRDLLLKTDKVHITGKGTDLTFSIKGIGCELSFGQKNLPDGEVTTAPVRDSVNGIVTYTAPSPYDGLMFENIKLTFEDGKIVDASCSNFTQRLNEILDTDPGARYIGEFAIGVNPMIKDPVGDILFDEKITGSFHFTPGNCYDNIDNGNHSSIHWDLIAIQRPEYGGGEMYFDDVLVRKDGLFVLDELKCLNPDALL